MVDITNSLFRQAAILALFSTCPLPAQPGTG
jgi:hypothetical protein